MRKPYLVLLVAVAIGVQACTRPEPPAAAAPPPPPPPPAPVVTAPPSITAPLRSPDATLPSAWSLVRDYAGPTTSLSPMPTAILLLRKNDAPAARTLCEGFLAIRSAAESKNTSQTLQNTLPLRWLLNVSQASPGQLRDCGFLTRHYDWQRADTLLGKIQWQHGAPTGAGPYIVVIQATAGGLRAAAADASKLTSRAQLRRLPQQFDKAVRQTLEGVATQERHDRLLMELHGWWQIGSNVLKLAFPPAEAAVNIIDGVIELTEAYES